ncbi:MAG: hypothetical protein ACFFHD_13620 [Promethearchaeota archaeon]
MLLYENKKQKLLNILKFTGSPFKKFVSTSEIEEELGIVQSREKFLESIVNEIEKNENFILPIVGNVGSGKTHLYWALKHRLYYYNIIYLSLETVYKRFYYKLYSEFIENMGVEPLRNITKQLCNEWGALERSYGFFHLADIEKIRKVALEKCKNRFENIKALNNAINAITTHQMDPYKKREAESWLLGELMDVKDLSRLNLTNDLRKTKNAFTMLKILIENSKLKSVLFIDDVEKITSIQKKIYESTEKAEEIEDIEEVFDPRWLYGNIKPLDKSSVEKILDKILQLQEIKGLRIIITLKSIDYFREIKQEIEKEHKDLVPLLKEPLFLSDFAESDIFQFYKRYLDFFFSSINYNKYFDDFSDSYYPLNEYVLKSIFNKAKGNPRQILKLLIKIFNEIVLTNKKLENILNEYQ